MNLKEKKKKVQANDYSLINDTAKGDIIASHCPQCAIPLGIVENAKPVGDS